MVAENRLGSSTRDWRLSLSQQVEVVSKEEEEEEDNVYEDLSLYSAAHHPDRELREDVSYFSI